MTKRKKVFSLLLALGLITGGITVNAMSQVHSERVTISFNVPDAIQMYVSGRSNTSKISTSRGSYLENHWVRFKGGYNSGFCAQLVNVKPWYRPNVTVDNSYTIGNASNPGTVKGFFEADQKLRTDFYASGLNGNSMMEESTVYKR